VCDFVIVCFLCDFVIVCFGRFSTKKLKKNEDKKNRSGLIKNKMAILLLTSLLFFFLPTAPLAVDQVQSLEQDKGHLKQKWKAGRSLFTWEGDFFAYFVARHFEITWDAPAPPM
jgi:hypothetical protein